MKTENQLLVRKIDYGTVLDHIPQWQAELVLKLLDTKIIREKSDISVVSLHNVPSKKYGKKDVIKLYHYQISVEDADLISLVFPEITINYIKDWKPKKYKPKIPKKIVGKIKCPELNCITNLEREPITTSFTVKPRYKVIQCDYCDTLLKFKEIPDYIKRS